MTDANRLYFQESPGLLSQYCRALLARGQRHPSPQLPGLEGWLTCIHANPAKVRAYAEVCGFNLSGTELPITYPHLLAFPLHMELMLHKSFPLPLIGLVHIRNHITQHRPLSLHDKLDIRCTFAGLQPTEKGLEFDIRTEISCAGELLWESISTNLSRRNNRKSRAFIYQPPLTFQQQQTWSMAENLGRKYARVSGDANPIHLFALSARLSGFPRHIAHGMWTKARAAATLYPLLHSGRCQLTTEFKLPVFLPAEVQLHWNEMNQTTLPGTDFELRSDDGSKTHLKGKIAAF